MTVAISITKFGEGWSKMANLPVIMNRFTAHFEELPRSLASIVVRELKAAARSNAMAPNSTATIAIKSSAVPLVETGSLIQSIRVKKMGVFDYYGGVDPGEKNANGVPLSNIAVGQNVGYIIPVDEQVRALMQANGLTVSKDTKFFVVPARPFLTRGFDKAEPQINKIIQAQQNNLIRILRVT